jgi:hypothetical protein
MNNPDNRPEASGERRLSPEERRRVTHSALLRPLSLFVVVIGGLFFALTLSWWAVVLTLATYAALVFLAVRDPLFWAHVLEGREYRVETRLTPSGDEEIPLEQRVRRLPPGETRQKVEHALELHRRTMVAIEESDDVARTVLADSVPKLRDLAGCLVEVAERREQVARMIRNPENHAAAPQREDRDADPAGLENELRAADEEISRTVEKLSRLRSRVVRVSAKSGVAAQEAAATLNADLDGMNFRLGALRSSTPSPGRSSLRAAHDPQASNRPTKRAG